MEAPDLEILQQELDTIQLLHHHNRNQHRGATWYKYVKLLKSSLTRILSAAAIKHNESKGAAKKQKIYQEMRRNTLYEDQVHDFLCRHQSMYIGFTRVIGTGQYVALGMILLGVLARCWQVIQRLVTAKTSSDEAEVESMDTKRLETVHGDDEGVVVERGTSEVELTPSLEVISKKPGKGRKAALSRRKAVDTSPSVSDLSSTEQTVPVVKRRKKRKVKNVDEIDSIFG